MSRAKTHRDVEFHVEKADGKTEVFRHFDEAAGLAVTLAVSMGTNWNIDVVIWSRGGARWYAGDDGVEQYDEDPEASVHERIVVRASSQGRVP